MSLREGRELTRRQGVDAVEQRRRRAAEIACLAAFDERGIGEPGDEIVELAVAALAVGPQIVAVQDLPLGHELAAEALGENVEAIEHVAGLRADQNLSPQRVDRMCLEVAWRDAGG